MFRALVQPVWVGIARVTLAVMPLAACGDADDTGDDTNTTTDTGEETGTAADTAAAIAPDTAGPTGPTGASDLDGDADGGGGADGNIDAPSNDTQGGGDTVTTDGTVEADDTGATEPPPDYGPTWGESLAKVCPDAQLGRSDITVTTPWEGGSIATRAVIIDLGDFSAEAKSLVVGFIGSPDDHPAWDPAGYVLVPGFTLDEFLAAGTINNVSGQYFNSPYGDICGIATCPAPTLVSGRITIEPGGSNELCGVVRGGVELTARDGDDGTWVRTYAGTFEALRISNDDWWSLYR